jgi:hypothetical protein
MNLSDRKKLAQLSRRLKAAKARYASLDKRVGTIEARRTAQQEKANRLINLLYSKKGQSASAARQKSITAQFVKANKEAERLEKQEKKIYGQMAPIEEKIATLKENMRKVQAKKNPEKKTSKGKTALKATGRALKGATRGILAAGSQILGAGATALNPHKRIKVRNAYVDLVIKGTAKKTPQGWKIGGKTFEQGRGTIKVASGYFLDRRTGMVYTKRERNIAGYKDESGQFHPIRSGMEQSPSGTRRKSKRKYKPAKVGEKRAYSTRKSAKRRASSRRLQKTVASRKRTTKSLAGRSLARTTSTGKRLKHASKSPHPRKMAGKRGVSSSGRKPRVAESKKRMAATRKRKTNPSAGEIRKEFAGRHTKDSRLYFPDGTPQGLAKLGKLVLIKTKSGIVQLSNNKGEVWLCADTNKRLHLGSTINAPLFDGARNFGEVREIEYQESKPHLGYTKKIIWFHHMGEEGGRRPELISNSKGELRFKGGDYRITTRGIEN